ncbi:MAG: phosphoenolpyruvate--protein phosphotransferase [Treponema sp.]|nr:phosphoenolpyruvate--protein phosphotransferase [Treponema sp.]
MDVFLGLSASAGIGLGKAFVVPTAQKRAIPQKKIKPEEHEAHWTRFQTSLQKISAQVAGNLASVKNDKVQSEIFETYFLMLNDPEFLGDVERTFAASDRTIEYILSKKTEEYAEKLRNSGNNYLAERAQDICDIFGRVLNDLLDFHPFDINQVPDGAVIVAHEMAPSDTIILSRRKIAGLALEEGGVSSHVGILARNFGIPAVFALNKITQHAKTGHVIVVDGDAGEISLNPDSTSLADYENKIAEQEKRIALLKEFRSRSALTKDGTKLTVLANIGTVEEAKIAVKEGADGIGLFRTEFLFMSENTFNEESQFKAYKTVLEMMGDKPVTIRTLDAGGDKLVPMKDMLVRQEKNPLMGLRAIRLSLAHPQQLRTQFRALYRASIYGNLKIMLPLITDLSQVRKAKQIAAEVRDSLAAEGIPFKADVPIGIMVETAAAAIIVDHLATVSDFFSIGTNDLTQYTVGVDRENATVAPLYNEMHLAVLRLIQTTIIFGTKAHIPISVCGEMASREDGAKILAGLGIRSLSMSPKLISGTKALLAQYTLAELEAYAAKAVDEE